MPLDDGRIVIFPAQSVGGTVAGTVAGTVTGAVANNQVQLQIGGTVFCRAALMYFELKCNEKYLILVTLISQRLRFN